jgi:hypothetical protein
VASSAIIGKVGIDQTTPGTTNAVSGTNWPTTVSVNTGATGASSPRVTVAVDSATVAGSATLPAGTNTIGAVNHAVTGLGHGFKTSTSVGTGVAIATTTAAKFITLQAYRSNTGFVAVGGSSGVNASATAGTGSGLNLAAGESVTFPIDNLADVFIDVTISGEGVRYTYGN